MIHSIIRVTRYGLFFLLIGIAVGLSCIRILLLSVDEYKTDLESKVFELTAIPIEIGALRANMRGFSPEIILKNIQVLAQTEEGEPAIQLEEIRLGINLLDLLLTQEILPSSWLTLVGAKLSIVRKEDGSLSVVGLNTDDSDQPYWLLEGGSYEVLKSDISWLDQQRHADLLHFKQVDLLLKNDFFTQSHEIHLISRLPEQYGETLRVSMLIQGDVFQADNINGVVYVEGKGIHLAELLTGEHPLDIEIVRGDGDFALWSQWQQSSLQSLIGNVNANNIDLVKANQNQQSFKISQIETKFNGLISHDGWQFGVSDLILKTENRDWPVAEFSLAANNDLDQIAVSTTQLDLQELAELIEFFEPLDKETHRLFSALGLKGMLKNFSIFADLKNEQYAINGDFENFYTNAYSKFDLPLLENLSGSIKGTNKEGLIALNTQKGALFFPQLFRQSFSIINLTGLLKWQQLSDKWLISSKSLVLETKDIQTETRVALTIPKNDAAVFMDLQAHFSHSQDVSSAPEYYPASIMDIDLLEWLDNAFVSGKIEQGDVLVYGELNKFPFSDGQGVFEVLYNMENVELQYNPAWPNLTNVNADVLFKRDSVTIDISHGEVNNLEIKHALVEIPSFATSNHLLVQGLVEGKIIDGLTFLQQTPVHAPVDSLLEVISPLGNTQVELDMKIPLAENARVKVDGVAHLANAALKVSAIDLDVVAVSGDLRFTENGLYSNNISAKSLGYPLTINVDDNHGDTAIKIQGRTNFFELKKQFDFFNTDFIKSENFMGSTAYQVDLNLPAAENQSAFLNINTQLVGMVIDLPAKLKKTAEQKKMLEIDFLLNKNKLLPITINYDNTLKAILNINKQQSTLHSAEIIYGNGLASMPQKKGINIKVEVDVFDLSEWVKLINISAGNKQKTELEINGISLLTKQLQWGNKNYGAFEIALQRFAGEWKGNLSCSAAKGAFLIPVNTKGKQNIKLNMAYLNLSELMVMDFQGINFTTDDLPLINVSSEKLLWNKGDLGKLKIETERILDGVRFKRISISSEDHKIELKADWVKNDTGGKTEVYGTLFADNFGKFLSRIKIDNDIEDAKAKIDFLGHWQGSPYQFSLQNMNAEMDVDIEDGRISSIEPGFGRILGLLAMEQWIKRLTLDFRDIYKQGLSFNSIKGHFKLKRGKAITKGLVVDAVPAEILIRGEADLLAKKLNHWVRVVPKSSGAVPIAGKIVSGIAGTITQIVTNDYKEGYFFGSKYAVTGTWDDIKVTPLHDQDGILKKTWEGLTNFSWMKASPD